MNASLFYDLVNLIRYPRVPNKNPPRLLLLLLLLLLLCFFLIFYFPPNLFQPSPCYQFRNIQKSISNST